MPTVVMYSTGLCPYCTLARRLLDKKGVAYTDIRVDKHPERREEMERLSARTSVPQIFVDDFHVGGFDDLAELDMEGRLDELLELDSPAA